MPVKNNTLEQLDLIELSIVDRDLQKTLWFQRESLSSRIYKFYSVH